MKKILNITDISNVMWQYYWEYEFYWKWWKRYAIALEQLLYSECYVAIYDMPSKILLEKKVKLNISDVDWIQKAMNVFYNKYL